MDTLFNEEAASPPGKHCARPINRMGYSPRAVSNQRKGSQFPARPLNQPRGLEPGTSTSRFRGRHLAHWCHVDALRPATRGHMITGSGCPLWQMASPYAERVPISHPVRES